MTEHKMEPNELLIKVLAAASVATSLPNMMNRREERQELGQVYQSLKDLIQDKYPQVNVDLLDLGPGSEDRQEALSRQLAEQGVTEDEEIVRQAEQLFEVISSEAPDSLWASENAETPSHLE